MADNPYEILGVSRSATPDEIKKAYRSLSKQWHPDKHKGEKAAEEKYKQINRAYEVLSDPKKRQMYDQYGTEEPFGAGGASAGTQGSPFGGGFSGFNFQGEGLDDLFASFFGGGRGGRVEREVQGRDIEATVQISMRDAYHGGRRALRISKYIVCEKCSGSGAREGSKKISCTNCSGTGQVTRTAQSFFGTIRQSAMCEKCHGSGRVPEHPCSACKGEGRVQGVEEVTVEIPRGIADGQTRRVHGKGEAGRQGAVAGDLYVHIAATPDPRFRREGNDLHVDVTIPVPDAVLGREVHIEMFDGPLTVKIPEGTQPGQSLRVKGKGMPVLGSSRFGDLSMKVNVELPKKTSRREKELWEELRGS
ncbi:MAG: molecular chaperone DnaJ [Patescibacteria group bacterium]